MAVLAGALIVMASVLKKTRTEIWDLRDTVDALRQSPPPAAPGPAVDTAELKEVRTSLSGLQVEQGKLREDLSETLSQSTLALRAADRDATADRNTMRKALARVLLESKAAPSEISALLAVLSTEERTALEAELGATPSATPPENDPGPENTGTPSGTGQADPPEEDPPNIPPAPDKPETAEPPPVAKEITYTVRPGDSLSKIARDHGISQSKLLNANNITNPNRIAIGMVLKIPKE